MVLSRMPQGFSGLLTYVCGCQAQLCTETHDLDSPGSAASDVATQLPPPASSASVFRCKGRSLHKGTFPIFRAGLQSVLSDLDHPTARGRHFLHMLRCCQPQLRGVTFTMLRNTTQHIHSVSLEDLHETTLIQPCLFPQDRQRPFLARRRSRVPACPASSPGPTTSALSPERHSTAPSRTAAAGTAERSH